jgi:hypothetical protein
VKITFFLFLCIHACDVFALIFLGSPFDVGLRAGHVVRSSSSFVCMRIRTVNKSERLALHRQLSLGWWEEELESARNSERIDTLTKKKHTFLLTKIVLELRNDDLELLNVRSLFYHMREYFFIHYSLIEYLCPHKNMIVVLARIVRARLIIKPDVGYKLMPYHQKPIYSKHMCLLYIKYLTWLC